MHWVPSNNLCFFIFTSSGRRKLAPRMFCDICDMFDLHDTDDCPTQCMSESPPPSLHHGDRTATRPYCEICEGRFTYLLLQVSVLWGVAGAELTTFAL